jgi:hypothetical protein
MQASHIHLVLCDVHLQQPQAWLSVKQPRPQQSPARRAQQPNRVELCFERVRFKELVDVGGYDRHCFDPTHAHFQLPVRQRKRYIGVDCLQKRSSRGDMDTR